MNGRLCITADCACPRNLKFLFSQNRWSCNNSTTKLEWGRLALVWSLSFESHWYVSDYLLGLQVVFLT